MKARLSIVIAIVACSLVGSFSQALAQPVLTDASELREPAVERRAQPEGLFGWPWEFGFGVRPGIIASGDRSRDAFYDSDSAFQLGLLLDVEPLRGVIGRDRWRFGIEWVTAASVGQVFQVIDNSSTQDHLMLSVDWGYPLFGFFTPYLRVAAGVAFYGAELTGSERLSDRDDWLFSGHALAGLELSTDWAVKLGIRTDLGYAFRTAPEFVMVGTASTPEDEVDMAMTGTSIGEVSMSGFEWGLEFFVRY